MLRVVPDLYMSVSLSATTSSCFCSSYGVGRSQSLTVFTCRGQGALICMALSSWIQPTQHDDRTRIALDCHSPVHGRKNGQVSAPRPFLCASLQPTHNKISSSRFTLQKEFVIAWLPRKSVRAPCPDRASRQYSNVLAGHWVQASLIKQRTDTRLVTASRCSLFCTCTMDTHALRTPKWRVHCEKNISTRPSISPKLFASMCLLSKPAGRHASSKRESRQGKLPMVRMATAGLEEALIRGNAIPSPQPILRSEVSRHAPQSQRERKWPRPAKMKIIWTASRTPHNAWDVMIMMQ